MPINTSSPARLSRERIVSNALELVETVGHDALSLRGLARSLDVTAPALYDHFGSKDELLRAVAADGYEELGAIFEQTPGGRAIDRCRARAKQYVQFAVDHPGLFRLMFNFRPAAVHTEDDNELPAATKAFEAAAVDVAIAVDEGDLVERDTGLLNLTIWAGIHGVAMISLIAPELGRLIGDDVVATVFAGLSPS